MGPPVPYAPATNLVVYNETTTTLNARWNPAPGPVQNYSITYVPTSGGRTQTVSSTPTFSFFISFTFAGLKTLQTDGCSDEPD